jgi:hypothetical protein
MKITTVEQTFSTDEEVRRFFVEIGRFVMMKRFWCYRRHDMTVQEAFDEIVKDYSEVLEGDIKRYNEGIKPMSNFRVRRR